MTGGAASKVREEIVQIALEINLEQQTFKAQIPADLACRFTASTMVEVLTWCLERGNAVSTEVAAGLLDRLMILPVIGSRP